MKILHRYILREIFTQFLLTLCVFSSILVTIRMLRLVELVIHKGVNLEQVLVIFLSIFPTFLEIAIPMSCLLAVILAIGRLSLDSEIIVIRASGLNLRQITAPVIIFGLASTLLTLIIALYIRPFGHQKLESTLFELASTNSISGLSEGVFNKLGNLIVYTDKIDYLSGQLGHTIIDDKRDRNNRQIILAQNGIISSNHEDRTVNIDLNDGYIHAKIKKEYNLTKFDTTNISIAPNQNIDPEESQKTKRAREMYVNELHKNITNLKAELKLAKIQNSSSLDKTPSTTAKEIKFNKANVENITAQISGLQIELWRKFSLPFACFVLCLLGMSLGIQPPRSQRSWGPTASVILAIVVMISYYGLSSVGAALTRKIGLHPLISFWIPNLFFLSIALVLHYKINCEQWSSISHRFETFVKSVLSKSKGIIKS